MHDTTSWRGAYARLAAELVSSDPDISIPELAQRLDMLTDDAADIAAVLHRWAQRAARAVRKGGWARFEHSNTL